MSSFQDFGLRPEILKAISGLGFETPTDIQAETIPFLLDSKKDLIAMAQTGTGKTAGFGLPILNQIDPKTQGVQALILSPTRELCMQISSDLKAYAKGIPGFRVLPVYGGTSIQPQISDLRRGVNVVVGTPGRTLDLINRRILKVNAIRWLVLDEADEMLSMGFKDDLDAILSDTPTEKQTLMFSATMPSAIRGMVAKFMTDPKEIAVGKKNAGAENVTHEYYVVNSRDRYSALKRVVDLNPQIYAIVFCRTRAETKDVADKLMGDGYNADTLHGDLSQAQRDFVMNRFRQKHLQILVATDVAARGLDVNDLTHVINYNLPDELESYIHRSGRTGRAGKMGTSVSIIHSREPGKIKHLERLTRKTFERKPVPNGRQICEKQLYNLIDRVEKVEVNVDRIEDFLPVIFKKLSWLERDELIKRFVSVEFNRFLAYYENAPDLNVNLNLNRVSNLHERHDTRRRGEKRDRTLRQDRSERRSSVSKPTVAFSRFFVNLGTKNNLTPGKLIGLINERTKKNNIEIGQIEMMKKFTFFEVDERFEREIITSFNDLQWGSVKVSVELKTSKAPKRIERNRNKNKRDY